MDAITKVQPDAIFVLEVGRRQERASAYTHGPAQRRCRVIIHGRAPNQPGSGGTRCYTQATALLPPHSNPPQGTGQVPYAIPAGDGFVTDPAVLRAFSNRRQCTTRYCTTGEWR